MNGRDHEVAADPVTPLLYVLRNDLGLKGTRFGCGTGHCGSCTVLVDGRAVRSCTIPLEAVAGRRVTTIEELSADGTLHPVQQALLDERAGECGYCMSGIVISAKALLDAVPRPTTQQIREALDGNLCRCGAHQRFIRAVARAAGV